MVSIKILFLELFYLFEFKKYPCIPFGYMGNKNKESFIFIIPVGERRFGLRKILSFVIGASVWLYARL